MLKKFKNGILTLLMTCVVSSVLAAGDPVYVQTLFGREGRLIPNSSLSNIDQNFLAYKSSIEKTYFIKNHIIFSIDEESPFYIQSNFDAKIFLTIISKDTNDVLTTTKSVTLNIDYNKDSGTTYNSAAYYLFEGGVDVEVKVDSIVSAASWDVSKVLKLTNEITAQRDWTFNCLLPVPNLRDSIIPNQNFISITAFPTDERTVQWGVPFFMQVTEYDLEWAWVDASALNSYNVNGILNKNKIFEDNATRITTSGTKYHIPLLYDGEGRLFIRIRPAQIKVDGTRYEGIWSYGSNDGLNYAFSGHENNLNWQATTTFAEEGKRKSVVQYFDGSLRGRQTVTKTNSTNDINNTGTTVVAETMYDYQGRPLIQVLPAPTINTIIGFTKNFNQFDDAANAKTVYDKLRISTGPCSQLTKKLLTVSGASRYYSPQNPEAVSGFNKYIPDAEGYPYTETRYTADGTGRIYAQGGLGTLYQINGGKETKYFYETPHQDELDGLFGTDAGVASHYSKNWVKDANGQYSISFTDMHGRTVATALSGTKPSNLDTISSYNNALKTVTRELIDETNSVSGNSIIMSKPLMVAATGDYIFHYSLTPEKFNLLSCNQPPQLICYDCLYELSIKIVPDCPETVIDFTNPLIVRNFTLNQYLSNCNGNNSPGFNVDFTVHNMPQGSYTIVKELKLNTDAQSYYRDVIYKLKNTCKTLQQFITEQYGLTLGQQNCNVSCTSCLSTLGTLEDFRIRFQNASQLPPATVAAMQTEIAAAYNQALANCDRICNVETDDGMDGIRSIREMMLDDVTPPTGQYAELNQPTSPFNIFNINNAYCAFPYCNVRPFTKPRDYSSNGAVSGFTDYKDEFNQAVQPYSNNAKQGLLTPQQFSDNFQDSYANQLIWSHPEFCKLRTTEQYLKPTYRFEATLQDADTWSKAFTKDFITNLVAKDSFFMYGAPGWQYRTQMLAKMNTNFIIYPANNTCPHPNISMWKMAQFAVFCHNTLSDHPIPPNSGTNPCLQPAQEVLDCFNQLSTGAPNATGHCAADLNMVWKNFRSFYVSYRKELIETYLSDVCNSAPTAAALSTAGFQPRFFSASNASSTYNLGSTIPAVLVNGTGTALDYTTALEDQADSTCRANAGNWIMKLRTCPDVVSYIDTHPAQWDIDSVRLINNLVNICKKGVDYMGHPFGASSLPASEPSVTDPLTGAQLRDFPQVIMYYLQSIGIGITAECHPYLIDHPAAYENAPATVLTPIITKPSQCECERITQFKLMWESSGYQGTFAAYLQNMHGTIIHPDTLNLLIQMCTTGFTGNNCTYLESPIILPAIFVCRGSSTSTQTCINCSQYNGIKAEFFGNFGFAGPILHPQTEAEDNINHAFETFANWRTGFSKSWMDYTEFGEQCANVTGPTCPTLDSLLQVFMNSPAHTQNPNGINCQNAFANFMNNALGGGVNYSYWYWVNYYTQICSHAPEVCGDDITCESLSHYINMFYNTYGTDIYQNANVIQLFVVFMNDHLQLNYNYEKYRELYSFLCDTKDCPKKLEIENFPNAILLTRFYDQFIHDHPLPANLPDCFQQFKDEFNTYFNLLWGSDEIIDAYHSFFNNGCYPDIDRLCDFPFSCNELQVVLKNFYGLYGDAISVSPNCSQLFTDYFNEQMHKDYSYAEILILYRKNCGIDVVICEAKYECEELMKALADFSQTKPPPYLCRSQFVVLFNQHFGSAYSTYEEIADIYMKNCDYKLTICEGTSITMSSLKMRQITTEFLKRYPLPYEELGEGDGKSVFTGLFNDAFGTSYGFDEIDQSYYVITGDSLHLFESNCAALSAWINTYQSSYSNVKLPLAARQDLFAYLYNKHFGEAKDMAFESIKTIIGVCNLLPFNLNNETGVYSLYDVQVLAAFKSAYYLMHPAGTPDDCERDFASWVNRTVNAELSYEDIQDRYEQVIGVGAGAICRNADIVRTFKPGSGTPPNPGPLLCGLNTEIFEPPFIDTTSCHPDTTMIITAAEEKYELYLDSLRNIFDAAYREKCLSAKDHESFTVTYQSADHHYTLYYYDQAGNLIKTVPPAGVDDETGNQNFLVQVRQKRAAAKIFGPLSTNQKVPQHTLVTNYRYNTLEQVVMQTTPDAGSNSFYYDAMGRLAASQNAKQVTTSDYSYTLYDALGRIKEVGQLHPSVALTNGVVRSPGDLWNWMNNKPAEQITRTVYDKTYFDGQNILSPQFLAQKNLRNRVSYSAVYNSGTPDNAVVGLHQSGTFYSYDIHGNVDTLLQDFNFGYMKYVNPTLQEPDLSASGNLSGNRFKKMIYNYDLISGKVNTVSYQLGKKDAFYHRYYYDAENKLTDVETSTDNVLWDHDANYSYYKHGPLAKMILGHNQVQGVDYAYTLQGWLKGVNSTSVGDGTKDMGNDGIAGTTLSPIARDVFGFSLNYNTSDYAPINGVNPFITNTFGMMNGDPTPVATGKPLFNGNIASMFVNIPKIGEGQLYGYKYDQLNRIVGMDAYKGFNNSINDWSANPVRSDDYMERVSYDANGNILTYLRNGAQAASGITMDKLKYYYDYYDASNQLHIYTPGVTQIPAGSRVTNRLNHVEDQVTGSYTEDIKDQNAGNYEYDAIGNLTKDTKENISNIEWTVYGKIKSVNKTSGMINYSYDASGNRISKSANSKITYYVRDAGGNVMSLYEVGNSNVNNSHLSQTELNIYGSSRLGVYNLGTDMTTGPVAGATVFVRGNKNYELSNHLGNVLVTVSDKKIGVRNSIGPSDPCPDPEDDCNFVSYYLPDVVTANDYYPFGMTMPGRKFSNGSSYRFGFGGHEKDNAISGVGNHLAFGDYGLDTRLGRRWNVEPMIKKYPSNSSYLVFGNNPLLFADPDGKDIIYYNQKGKETNRTVQEGAHVYYMQHNEGNVKVGNKSYYQGNSYASFFGDRTNPGLFSKVDATTIKNDAAIKVVVDKNTPANETLVNFGSESRTNHKYDYKNTILSADNGADNAKTAYMVNGILHNRNEAGNILWGATTSKIGLTGEAVWLGSQGFTLVTERQADEVGEQNAIYKGRTSYGIPTQKNTPSMWDYFKNGKRATTTYEKKDEGYLNRDFIGNLTQGDDPTKKK